MNSWPEERRENSLLGGKFRATTCATGARLKMSLPSLWSIDLIFYSRKALSRGRRETSVNSTIKGGRLWASDCPSVFRNAATKSSYMGVRFDDQKTINRFVRKRVRMCDARSRSVVHASKRVFSASHLVETSNCGSTNDDATCMDFLRANEWICMLNLINESRP